MSGFSSLYRRFAIAPARFYLEQLARSKGRRRLCIDRGICEPIRPTSRNAWCGRWLMGQPMREAARRFGVAVTTVKRAVVQERLHRHADPALLQQVIPNSAGTVLSVGARPVALVRRVVSPTSPALDRAGQWRSHPFGEPQSGIWTCRDPYWEAIPCRNPDLDDIALRRDAANLTVWFSANQRLPSGPLTIPKGTLLGVGR